MCGTIYGFNPGINHKSRVLIPSIGFLSCATWFSLRKKHYKGLINHSTIICHLFEYEKVDKNKSKLVKRCGLYSKCIVTH